MRKSASMAELRKEFGFGCAASLARRGPCGADRRQDFGIGARGFEERPLGSNGSARESARLDIKRDVFGKDIARH